jgi:hypothetical protein
MVGFILIVIFYVLPFYVIVKFAFFGDDKPKELEPSRIVMHNYRLKPKRRLVYREATLSEAMEARQIKEKLDWLMREWRIKS